MTKREFESIVKPKIAEIGFKTKGFYFYKQLSEKIFGVITFGYATQYIQGIMVLPTVRVFHSEVEGIYDQLTGKNSSKEFGSILSTPLYCLIDEKNFKQWDFSKDSDHVKEMQNLIESILNYAIPFLKNYSAIEATIKAVQNIKYSSKFIQEFKLPILYYLNGQKQKGIDFINAVIEKYNAPGYFEQEQEKARQFTSPNTEMVIVVQGWAKSGRGTWNSLKSLQNSKFQGTKSG